MEMSFLKKIGLAFFFFLCFITIVKTVKDIRRDPSSYPFIGNAESGSDAITTPPEIQNEFQELVKYNGRRDIERQTKLVEMTDRKMKREMAIAKKLAFRTALSASKQIVWNQILMTNSTEFYALRKIAARTPGGVTPCTLCDGEGYMDECIVCKNSDGKCVTCYGTGTLNNGKDICPTCIGSKNCYFCNGFKKMLCPFCDDGMIDIQVPLPPEFPPTN